MPKLPKIKDVDHFYYSQSEISNPQWIYFTSRPNGFPAHFPVFSPLTVDLCPMPYAFPFRLPTSVLCFILLFPHSAFPLPHSVFCPLTSVLWFLTPDTRHLSPLHALRSAPCSMLFNSDFRILFSSIPHSAFPLPHSDDHLQLGLAGSQSFDLGNQIAHDLGKLDAVAGTDPG